MIQNVFSQIKRWTQNNDATFDNNSCATQDIYIQIKAPDKLEELKRLFLLYNALAYTRASIHHSKFNDNILHVVLHLVVLICLFS